MQNVGGTYTRTDKHGIKANFSSAGLLTSRVDRNNNTTTFTYTSGQLTQITDPFSRNINLTYTNGRLSSVSDFASRSARLTYTNGNLTNVTLPDPDGAGSLVAPDWDFSYDAASNHLTQLVDPLNRDTDFAYGSHGRVVSITHFDNYMWELTSVQTIGLPTAASGNTLTPANPLGNVKDERSNNWTYRLDQFGKIQEWSDPLGNKTIVERNADGLPAKLTQADPDGTGTLTSPVTIFGYDTLGNQRYQRNPDNSTRTWTYSTSFNQVLTATDELNRVTEYTYDARGNLTRLEDAADNATTFVVNSRGLVTSMSTPDPDGTGPLTAATTQYAYDGYGRLTTTTYADTSTRVYGYDSADNRTSDQDELAHVATFTFDKLDRLTSATDRANAVTTYAYNGLGLLTKMTNALGKETDYEYNNRNRLSKVTRPDPDGVGSLPRPETTYEYDAVGNKSSNTLPGQNPPLTYSYNGANRLTQVRVVLNTVSYDLTYLYDNLGRLTRERDRLNHQTDYEYNSRGWVTKITGNDPDGSGAIVGPITQFSYDLAGQKTSVTDPRGFVTTYTYDPRGMLITTTQPDPDGAGPLWAPTTYQNYDNVGRLKSIDDPLCRITVYAYNNRDRLISKTLPDPDGAGSLSSPVWTFGYDVAGRQTTISDPLSRTTIYTYDDVGRVLTETKPDPDGAGSLTSPVTIYTYNALGNVLTVTDPRGKVTTYGYDNLQRQTSVTLPDPDGAGPLSAPITNYFYNSQELLSKITDALSHDTTFQYDDIGRKTGVTDHQGNQVAFGYNAADMLTSVTLSDPDGAGSLTSPVTSYTYDDWKRLKRITDPLNGFTDFTYDSADNLLTIKDPVNNVTSYAYDNIGRLAIETNQLSDSRSFTYDSTGSLTRRVDRNARVMQFVRDNLDRTLKEEWYANATPAPSLSISTTTEGGPANEVQRVGFTALGLSGGTFTLSFNGSTTSPIAYNASAAAVQSALQGLSSIGSGNVVVAKLQDSNTAQEWRLTFQGNLAASNVVQTTIDSSAVTYYTSLANIQATDAPGGVFDEVQSVTLSNSNGGTFRLAFLGEITAPLNWNATAAAVDTALENLNAVNLVSVTGNIGGPWTITFVGTHSQTNVSRLNGDASTATNGTLQRTINYTYDAADQLTTAWDPDSGYDYTYDNLGRVLTVDNDDAPDVPRVVLTSAYDAANNRTSLSAVISSTNDFLNTYTFDGLNRLTRLDQTGQTGGNTVAEKRVDFSYSSVSLPTEITRYKDTDGGSTHEIATSTYTYDTLNRLTGLAYKKGGTNLFTPYGWTFDKLNGAAVREAVNIPKADSRVAALARGAFFAGLGRITQMTSADGTTDYTYDASSQLAAADHSYQADESYSYDSNGNRNMTGYSIGANNQLLNDGTYTYQYDDEGNRIRRVKNADSSSTEYEWDFRNRLTQVTDKNSSGTVTQAVKYRYDVFDRRNSRQLDTTSPFNFDDALTELYVLDDKNGTSSLDGGNVVLDFVDSDGLGGSSSVALTKRYLYGDQVDHVLAQENLAESITSSQRILLHLTDHQRTVRDLYRTDASSAQHYTYSSFGSVTTGDISLTRYLYTSRDTDGPLELQYNRARWLDPGVGRWVTDDPLGFLGATANLIGYLGNSPMHGTDPTGLVWHGPLFPWPSPRPPLAGRNVMPTVLHGTYRVSVVTQTGGIGHAFMVYEELDTNGNPTGKFHTAGNYAKGYGGWAGQPATYSGAQWDHAADYHRWLNSRNTLYTRSIIMHNPVPRPQLGYNSINYNCATYARDSWHVYSGEYVFLFYPHLPDDLQDRLKQIDEAHKKPVNYPEFVYPMY